MLNSANYLMQLQGELTKPVDRKWDTKTLNRRNEWLLKCQERGEVVAAKEKTILTNRLVSDEGKRKQLIELGTESLSSFAWEKNVVQGLEDTEARFKKQFYTVESPVKGDDVLQFLRAQEIRHGLGHDPLAWKGAFVKAAEQNRVEVLWAILNSPMGEVDEMVGADHKTDALTERAKRLWPVEYEQYTQNTLLVEYMRALRTMTAVWLRNFGVDPKAIADTLGGEMTSTLGTPDGRERLQGAAWAQAIAAGV